MDMKGWVNTLQISQTIAIAKHIQEHLGTKMSKSHLFCFILLTHEGSHREVYGAQRLINLEILNISQVPRYEYTTNAILKKALRIKGLQIKFSSVIG